MQNCLMALEPLALCQISFHVCRVEVMQWVIILEVIICLHSLLLPTHYNNREKPLLCRYHIDDDIVIVSSSNTFSAFVMGNSDCYELNLNVVPLRSVPAILFNTSVSV